MYRSGELTVKAAAMSRSAEGWLQRRRPVSILHTFDQACNLIDDEGDILSLVTPEIGPGPFAVVLPLNLPFTRFVTLESSVSLDGTTITVGAITIETAGTRLWHSRPPWHRLCQSQLSLVTTVFRSRASQAFQTESNSALAASADQRLASAGRKLISGLDDGDENALRESATALAGLGNGLTPAGDDFLMGAIYALWALRSPEEAHQLANLIVETAVPLTTSLSGAWLRAAARGEAAQPWHDLVSGLIDGNKATVAGAVDQILAIGHSSGADALAGFTAVIDSI
jgi:hypothetical protein